MLIRQLVDSIVVTPIGGNGKPKVELFGALAPVLTAAHTSGGPEPNPMWLKVVAEEGLEPPTRGL